MDIQLFCTDNGSENGKCPLILLHGNGGNSSSFFYVVDYFAKKRRVITVDTRGHGRTPKGDTPFTLVQFSKDLRDFMDEKGIPKADFIGYSDGGNIALLFALSCPEYVSSLVLNGSNLFPEGLEEKDRRWILSTYRKAKKQLRKHPQNNKAKDKFDMFSLMVNEPKINPLDLCKITVPALVLVGSRDAIKPEHTRLICRSLPKGQLSVINGGHNIVKTNSEPYIAAVDNFLTSPCSDCEKCESRDGCLGR